MGGASLGRAINRIRLACDTSVEHTRMTVEVVDVNNRWQGCMRCSKLFHQYELNGSCSLGPFFFFSVVSRLTKTPGPRAPRRISQLVIKRKFFFFG